MTAPIPTTVRAAAIVDLMTGTAKPADVAAKVGVTPQTLRAWRDSLETDAELRAAVHVALRTALQGWRPRVAELVVKLVEHVERLLATPDALDAETAIGAIRSLAGLLGQVDVVAKRYGADDDDGKGTIQ